MSLGYSYSMFIYSFIDQTYILLSLGELMIASRDLVHNQSWNELDLPSLVPTFSLYHIGIVREKCLPFNATNICLGLTYIVSMHRNATLTIVHL